MILIPSMICKNIKQKEIENLLLTPSHEKYGLAVLVPSFEKASKYTSYGAILANKGTPNMYSTVIDFVRLLLILFLVIVVILFLQIGMMV